MRADEQPRLITDDRELRFEVTRVEDQGRWEPLGAQVFATDSNGQWMLLAQWDRDTEGTGVPLVVWAARWLHNWCKPRP